MMGLPESPKGVLAGEDIPGVETIAADEFAFTIGGSNPIDTDTIWLTQQDPEATESVGVDVIAYR